MKTLIVVAIMAIALAAALPAAADVQVYGDLYYRISPPVGSYAPTGGPPSGPWVWPGLYTNQGAPIPMLQTSGPGWADVGGPVAPLAGGTLPANSTLLLGFENLLVQDWVKYVNVRITLTDTSKTLAVDSYAAGGRAGLVSTCDVIKNSHESGAYSLIIRIRPQPDWEWIAIKNTSGSTVTFSMVSIDARCSAVPSLTGWGIGALVILLAGTAVWLVRRRKPVLSA